MSASKLIGDAGARKAATTLCKALCGELSFTTLNEDHSKVDIKLSYNNIFDKNHLVTQHCQVKTGSSYRTGIYNAKSLTLSIDAGTIYAMFSSIGILVWVPPNPSSYIYWYLVDPRAKITTPIKIPRYNYVRPSIRIDLGRFINYSKWTERNPRLTTSQSIQNNEVLKLAKAEYFELKNLNIHNPLVGKLIISRLAWRHVTRRSKTSTKRYASLRLVPYLKSFLSRIPDRYLSGEPKISHNGKLTTDVRYILFWYRNALVIDGRNETLVVRIKEEIQYPRKWESSLFKVDELIQKTTLASWWVSK